MSLIKVGDRIKFLKDKPYSACVASGDIGKVIAVDDGDNGGGFSYLVAGDEFPWSCDMEGLGVVFVILDEEIAYTQTINTVESQDRIDGHYDFFYELSQFEAELLQLKVDPYFIAKQWRIGERDPSGVLFHILKTIARFGDKNPKEREIKAIYLQIKRLAELEGVELE